MKDCADGSDEQNCYKTCKPNQFYCPSGMCISLNLTCNGVWNCPDGADEPLVCGNKTTEKKMCSLDDLGCLKYSRNTTFCHKFADGSCDFEKDGFCDWQQIQNGEDNFDWSINSGETSSKKTGPDVDYTTGSKKGSYIYIEASSPRVQGDKAILKAGPFENDVNLCFTFRYHMFGSNIGSLSVYQAWNKTNRLRLWRRNTSTDNSWKTAWLEIRSEQQFFLLMEGVCGNGALGDIAVDDISIVHKNCSQVHNVTSPFCSFEKNCIWKWTAGVWELTPVGNKNNFLLQDYFLKTKTSGELWATLSEEMTEQFQCMTFWYTFYYCNGMSFYSTQELESNTLEMDHSLSDVQKNIQWLFGEMPLQKRYTKSKVTFKVHIQSQTPYAKTSYTSKCYLGIDEINFSVEPCLSFQQGGSAWIRKSSKFYRVLKKQNRDGSITAFYNSSFDPSDPDTLRHLDFSRSRSQSFIAKMFPNSVNSFVEDVKLLELSKHVGERVFVKESVNTAVIGTVIFKTVEKFEHKLTVKLDSDGLDIVPENGNIYALPYQLDRHGPAWLTTNQYCISIVNGSCYFFLKTQHNWFDGVDNCKTYGGEIGKFNSELEEKSLKKYKLSLPFWIGYHSHRYHGTKFVWSDGSADVYNKLDRKSETQSLTAGLCTLVTNSTLWKRANCSETHFVLCRKPDKEQKIINSCREETLACPMSKTVIRILLAELVALTHGMCSISVVSNKTCAKLYINSQSQVLAELKTMCEGRNKCNISINTLSSDPCPFERKYMEIWYNCIVRPSGYPVLAATNSVFRPKGWKKFCSSYYKLYTRKTTWQEAEATCNLEEGATLVSFNNKQEEDYVTKQMKSNGINTFHIGLKSTYYPGNFLWLDGSITSYRNWANDFPKTFTGKPMFVMVGLNGWFASDGNITAAFMCKYTPGIGPCDFETNWCGWRNNFTTNDSRWYRSAGEDSTPSEESLFGVYRRTRAFEQNVYTYAMKKKFENDIYFKADRPKEIKQLTLCFWVYINKRSSSRATVILFGTKLQVKIYLRKDFKFGVGLFVWNSTTNASVSFDSWQHLCFTIDTHTNLWSFYKNGLLTDVALLSLPTYSLDVFDTEDNKVFLGRNPNEIICSFDGCTNFEQLEGKITKPIMWSRIVDAHEISILASGCGIFSGSGNIEVSQDFYVTLEKRLIDHGECTSGKSYRLICRNDNNTSSIPSISSLVSPWMRSSLDRVRGACMNFTYRLLGQGSQMSIWVEPRNIKKERLWSVTSSRTYNLWKNGRVFLGVVSEFRVHVTTTLWSNTSEVNLDNIFFTEGYCAPNPIGAQEWHTDIANSSSGYLTSPYYPSLYLNNMNRSWKIQVPANRRIKLKVLFQNLEYDRQCSKDSVIVKHASFSRKFISYCGNTLPASYFSTSNMVYVHFQSNDFNVGTGFKIHFQTINAEIIKDSCQENDILDCLSTLRCSAISSNKSKIFVHAQDLLTMPKYFPAGTNVINFDDNTVVRLTATDFVNLMQVEYLSISKNKIIDIDTKAFSYLSSLQILRLSLNFIDRLPKTIFHQVNSLEVLDLSMNRIHNLGNELFVGLKRLRLLSLRKNFITSLEDPVFSSLDNLQYLYLDENYLFFLESNVFNANVMLKVLSLKKNKLETVKASWLTGKHFLQTLELQHNNIKDIETGAFDDLKNLVELDISNNKIQIIPENLFQNLVSLRNLKVDHFTMCCYAKQNNPAVSCISKEQDGFSSCDELLKNLVLKYSIWILGLMAFFGNLIVIAWRSFSKDKNRVSSFLLTNLAVADFLMGVYMLLIAYKDRVWDGIYFKHDISWRASNLCIFAGVISTVSSEVSVLTLTVITLERMVCIVFPFKFRRWSMKKSSGIMILVWIIGICISLVPLTNDAYFYDYENSVHFFGRSAVCLPFQLSSDRTAGWEYSVFVFLVLNGVSFLFMLVAYVLMYRTVVKAASAVRSTRVNKDSAIAKRMMFIILTDFLCWFPVIILSILALTGNLYDPSKQVYAWIAVFVLPINSSINPLLYTFSTPYIRNRIPTAKSFSTLSTHGNRKSVSQKVCRENTSDGHSSASFRNTIQTDASSLSLLQSICGTKFVNNRHTDKESIAESSFTKSLVPQMDYFIKFMEDTQSFENAEKSIKSYVAVETEHKPALRLVHIYKSKQEELWLNTINILSWLHSDGGHENILPYLWSAKAEKVHVEKQKSFKITILDLELDDCLICYQLPSKQTLANYLEKKQDVTGETICFILTDIMKAVNYLSSKGVIHEAIIPENVFLSTSNKALVEKAVLGGFHALKILTLPITEDEERIINHLDFNVKSFGKLLKILLDACPAIEMSDELSDIMALCLNEICANKPTTSDLLKRLEVLMLCNLPSNDAIY